MSKTQASDPAPTWQEMSEFLRGREPLEGVWFGEPHPTRTGMYWWRSLLPAAIPAPEGALPPLPAPHWPRGYQGCVPSGGYTADQMHAYARAALAAPAPQAPVALTDEQIDAKLRGYDPDPSYRPDGYAYRRGWRDAEQAHGITQTKEPTNDR